MIKWIFIIVIAIATLSLNGCAKDATAEDSVVAATSETSTETTTNSTSGETIWIAIVMTWRPVIYTIDKEFSSEVDCWNYYEEGVGESKFGTQVLDHQGNTPGKEYLKKHRPPHREYPIRMYKGVNGWTRGLMWLTCDIKGRNEGL